MGESLTHPHRKAPAVARTIFDDWIPEEQDSDVIQRIRQMSVVEDVALRVPMGTDTRTIPRSGGVEVEGVGKGQTYGEDVSLNDEVLLTARKMGKAIRIADEDLADSPVAIIQVKQRDWATSYAKYLDNSTLGCTGAENGTTVLFTSVYRAIRTDDPDVGYVANSNYTATGSGGPSYDALSETVNLVENSDYWAEDEVLVLAHPTFRKNFRGIKDDSGRPIFISGREGTPDTLFELPVRWSMGARTSAINTARPGGNPLMIVGNRTMLKLGMRSGPESRMVSGDTGIGFLSDESILKMRSRRGFTIGHPGAFAIMEDTR
ncbi:phage major capsid protein [Frankia sp. R43]|uniref:phage major capsid protein n=1 Tax=Frankia sp. R43 TaxID=269536 RepID=UPI000A5DDA87|nr:phage major capsid protein [Frankia sp. R43]